MIGNRIKTMRINMGITQEVLANALHISPQAISKWERGIAEPDISILIPLADYFGISVDSLLRDKQPIPEIDNSYWKIKILKPLGNIFAAEIKNLSQHFFEYLEYEVILTGSKGEMLDFSRSRIYDFPSGYTKNIKAFFPGIKGICNSEFKIIGCRIRE